MALIKRFWDTLLEWSEEIYEYRRKYGGRGFTAMY